MYVTKSHFVPDTFRLSSADRRVQLLSVRHLTCVVAKCNRSQVAGLMAGTAMKYHAGFRRHNETAVAGSERSIKLLPASLFDPKVSHQLHIDLFGPLWFLLTRDLSRLLKIELRLISSRAV